MRLELRLGDRYSPDTVRAVTGHARAFLRWRRIAGQGFDKAGIQAYADSLIREEKLRGSIQVQLAHLRMLFGALDVPWPFKGRELHISTRVEDSDEGGPVLPPADVERLVLGAIQQFLGGTPTKRARAACVALSTIWGFRAIELERILAGGLDGVTVRVRTGKGGMTREHPIPSVLRPILTLATGEAAATRATLHQRFIHLMRGYVRDPRYGEGWHSIRRSLVTGLYEAGVDEPSIYRWMGWKRPGTAFKYFRPDQQALEEKILAKHPFLQYWMGGKEILR